MLPNFPPRNAGHLIQEKVSYHDFSWGSGVFYLVQYTQGPGQFPNNEELTYLFQGISNDEGIYVSAEFRVTHPMLPDSTKAYPKTDTIDDDAKEMAKRLDRETNRSFAPTLDKIRNWIGSIDINSN